MLHIFHWPMENNRQYTQVCFTFDSVIFKIKFSYISVEKFSNPASGFKLAY